jgi:hypothetical protein
MMVLQDASGRALQESLLQSDAVKFDLPALSVKILGAEEQC